MSRRRAAAAPAPDPLLDLLGKHWGFGEFRPLQREMIEAAVAGRDVLGILPTGGGKSLIYQLAGLARGGLTLVISPLVALMEDQVKNLQARGLPAAALHSGLSDQERYARLDAALEGHLRWLYLAPERLHTPEIVQRMPYMRVGLLAVDEAHCVSQWGFDFRPAYTKIAPFRSYIPGVPLVALTATATPRVRQDIVQQLDLNNPAEFRGGFARPDLTLAVRLADDKARKLADTLAAVPGSALVYVRTRAAAEDLARQLRHAGHTTGWYHAGLPPQARLQAQQQWLQNQTRVLVATTAFGMGVDKPDVRLLVHYDIPEDPESYYQEVGRAGRDGAGAYALLLTSPEDPHTATRRWKLRYPSLEQILLAYEHLANQHQLTTTERPPHDWQRINLEALTQATQLPHPTLMAALRFLAERELLDLRDAPEPQPYLRLMVSTRTLDDFADRYPHHAPVLDALLRTVGGQAFESETPFDFDRLRNLTQLTMGQLNTRLQLLAQQGLLQFRPPGTGHWVRHRYPRLRLTPSVLDWPRQQALVARAWVRQQWLLDYARQTNTCRMQLLCSYFGESLPQPCGRCDVCRTRRKGKA